MAVYRIFPEKDTFIHTSNVNGNSGRDEILEISNTGKGVSRVLMKFSDEEIANVISLTGEETYQANIKAYLAYASSLPVDYTLNAYPVVLEGVAEWTNGTGKKVDLGLTTGTSWKYIDTGVSEWITVAPSGADSHYEAAKEGGGTWTEDVSTSASQTHLTSSTHDLDINVTTAINNFHNSTIDNKGFVIKLEDSKEFDNSNVIELKYFSGDTNTIYPPFLEIKWDDSTYDLGTLTEIATSLNVVRVKNNKGEYPDLGKQRFRLTVRPTYPERTFETTSTYSKNYALPEESTWGLRDENTEEMVVPFDAAFTKISCDSKGSYFDVYMEGLQPERYYRILIKSEIDGSTTVLNNANIFKVVRNG